MNNEQYLANLLPRTHNDDNARDMYRILSMVANRLDFGSFAHCFDIGSRDLTESVSLATAFPQACVHAFEASPDCIAMCNANLLSMNDSIRNRIKFNDCAMNNISGEITFYPLDTDLSEQRWGNYNYGVASKLKLIDGLNGTFLNEHWVQKQITVAACTLDQYCDNNNIVGPDLIWMDVQGAELDVLQGGKRSLLNTKLIMTEAGIQPYYHGHGLFNDIDQYLHSLGFVEVIESRKVCHSHELDVVYVNTAHYTQEYANQRITI